MTALPPSPPPDKPDPTLGRVIRHLREERGWSGATLAARSGLDERTLARVESATIDPPWATVEAIAAALEVSMETIASAAVGEDANGR